MPSVKVSPPRSVSMSVFLNWQRRGEAKAYFGVTWEQVQFFWPTNFADTRPGLYRITVMDTDFRQIYIGESDRICRRLGDYTRVYRSKPRSTTPFQLTFLIRKALVNGHPVYLDTASTGKLVIGGSERRLNMQQKSQRLLAEAAAVLQEEDANINDNTTWILNKHLDDPQYRTMTTADLFGT
jgi:hypothetical protein